MRKLMAFGYVLFKSVTAPKYYRDIIKVDLKFTIKYFVTLSLILAALSAGMFSVKNGPEMDRSIAEFIEKSREVYPDDLIVITKSGAIKVNKPEPYFIKIPKTMEEKETYKNEGLPTNLIVFDSKGTINDIEKYDTYALINSKNILVQDNRKIQAYPTKDFPDGKFAKTDFNVLLEKVTKVAKYVPAFSAAGVFIGMSIYYMGYRALYLFFAATIIMIFGKFKDSKLEFVKYYQIAMHAITLPLIIEFVLGALDIKMDAPFWFLVLNVIVGLLAVAQLKNKDETIKKDKQDLS